MLNGRFACVKSEHKKGGKHTKPTLCGTQQKQYDMIKLETVKYA